ncbi:3-oxoacyl-[acyl-carrier-protein] reductase [Catenisphaera adipataccumulans]|uniref:3-oxoacyl-[acyl-carrier-protein] reductase n=1 Tax=Catenisphaera adipataccumulans TaxID=700500 RepID=A0A7W8CXP6_9FIRM|nr:3-oxoacyl-[acyl-carrier-protein] reductase [Catenisphaera adipataccumulans]MBB5182358.1 3-oxoacyl-[acyl-carrier protein] reductase [Catenisphaera adipataccumulans]
MSKIVLITGSSRGIGKAMALAFARAGYTVIVNYRGNQEAAEATLAQVQTYSPESMMIQADVADNEGVRAMFQTVKKQYGRLDVLINNSGINRDGMMLRMTEADFDQVLNVNLKGAFLVSKEAGRLMLRQKSGSIINMSSIVGVIGNAGQCNYAAAKAGLIGLTKSLAKELASRNIRVNAIAPGFIDTEMTAKLPEDVKKQMLGEIPMRRFGTPEDIAKTALFLAGADSTYITGQVIHVNGGMWM